MVFGTGGGVEVIGNPQLLPAIQVLTLVKLGNFQWGFTRLFGFNSNGCTVLVRARDHQYFVAFKAVVAGEDIRRKVGPGNLTNMQRAVGIRPGDPDENSLAHMPA
jgi:hypothetical protein